MYSFFSNLSKPIVILGILVIGLLLFLTVSSGISGIGTMLGLDTKENTAIRLEKTNGELEKATDLLENNELKDKVVKEVEVITDGKAVKDAIVIDTIKSEEVKVLEQIKNTVVDNDTTPTDTKPLVDTIKTKPTVVYIKKKLNNKQKLALSILRDRAKLLKGHRV